MATHILGIRHHGVGSARQVEQQLAELKPDIILVEGPPEIESVFHHVGDTALKPPAAIMVYDSADPKSSTFYPFAEYSPEWVAIKYANEHQIPVRAMDLPAAISFAKRNAALKQTEDLEEQEPQEIRRDPLNQLAETTGFGNGEEFWEYHFEHNQDSPDHFQSVMYVMDSLRSDGLKSSLDQENVDREAYMRSIIQTAQNEMYTNIAVICGAWHAPALTDLDAFAKEDQKILKKLPKSKIKITCTWIPWTNGRLSMFSGYGAGIYSPGWYSHLWEADEQGDIQWLTRVAEIFRSKDMDISTAHVIETFRLARSLAAIRDKYFVSLQEMNDAILSVMCMGDEILLELVKKELIVGERLGEVPEDIPKMPLQKDFELTIKKLRLKLSAAPKQHDLDLRKDLDLARSIFFHRLEILKFPWTERTHSRSKGTFKESWTLQWSPEMMINLIDKAYYGNTVENAAQRIVLNKAEETDQVNVIASLIQLCIPAELFEELDQLLTKINELSSISTDILDLIKAVPQLVDISRYGDVRKTDLTVLNVIIDQLLIKINTGLPNACYGLDEVNSMEMFEQISSLNHSIKIYADEEAGKQWYETLFKILEKEGVHAIITGCVCRLLLDAQQFTDEEADQRISLALSVNNEPVTVAAWIEGFLKGSGMILIYDNRLWNLLYEWVSALEQEVFLELLPLLRRSFSKFEYGERRQIGAKAKEGLMEETAALSTMGQKHFDVELAEAMVPVISKFLNPKQNG